MTTPLRVDAGQAARLRVDHFAKAGARSRRFRLDSDGVDVAVELPAPAQLAALVALDGLDVFRAAPGFVLARPEGSDAEPALLALSDLRAPLWDALSTLPDDALARQGYRDLRLCAATRSATFAAYLDDVLAAWRRAQRARPRATGERAPAKSPEERARTYRARKRAAVRASALWALTMFLTLDESDEDPRIPPGPGERVPGSALYEYAVDLIEDVLDEYADADPEDLDEIRAEYVVEPPLDLVRVSRQALYAAALAAGHKVTRPGNAVTLTIRLLTRLKEKTVNVLTRVSEVLGYGPRTPEECEVFADAAVAEALALAPATRPPSYDARLLALPRSVLFALSEPDAHSRRMFATVATEHLKRNPDARPVIVEVARALRDGDPDGLVEQARAMVADALTEEASA